LGRGWRSRLGRNHDTWLTQVGPVVDLRADIERQRDRERRDADNEDHQYSESHQKRLAVALGFLGAVEHCSARGGQVTGRDGGIGVRFLVRCGAVSKGLPRGIAGNRPVSDGETSSQGHFGIDRTGAGILRIRQGGRGRLE
jgi:hypothetical protein